MIILHPNSRGSRFLTTRECDGALMFILQKGPIDMCLFPVTNPQEHISILRLSHGMESVT